MIKKLNIALAVLFAAMFVLKGLRSVTGSKPRSVAAPAAMAAPGDVSLLAPRVYYQYWAGYTLENPISNRNGVLLDIVRAVFPNATFTCLHGDIEEVAEKLRTDDRAVVVGFGAHEALAEFPSAPTPLMHCPLVLMTLRTNPWCYEDFSSLTNLKIVASDAFLDYPVIRRLKQLTNRGEANLLVMTNDETKVELGEMVLKGKADALAVADLQNAEGAPKDGLNSVKFIQSFRKSPVIASEGTLLYATGIDADFSGKIIEDFEKGFRRIDERGELRRICEYYGVSYESPRPCGASAP